MDIHIILKHVTENMNFSSFKKILFNIKVHMMLFLVLSCLSLLFIDLKKNKTISKMILIANLIVPLVKITIVYLLIFHKQHENSKIDLDANLIISNRKFSLQQILLCFFIICIFIYFICQLLLFKSLWNQTKNIKLNPRVTLFFISLPFILIFLISFKYHKKIQIQNSVKTLCLSIIIIIDFICSIIFYLSYQKINIEKFKLDTDELFAIDQKPKNILDFVSDYIIESDSSSDIAEMKQDSKNEITEIDNKINNLILKCTETNEHIEKRKFILISQFENIRSLISDLKLIFLFNFVKMKSKKSISFKYEETQVQITKLFQVINDLKAEFDSINIDCMKKYDFTFELFYRMKMRSEELLNALDKKIIELNILNSSYDFLNYSEKFYKILEEITNLKEIDIKENSADVIYYKWNNLDNKIEILKYLPNEFVADLFTANDPEIQNSDDLLIHNFENESRRGMVLPVCIDPELLDLNNFFIEESLILNLKKNLEEEYEILKEIIRDYSKIFGISQINNAIAELEIDYSDFDSREFLKNIGCFLENFKENSTKFESIKRILEKLNNENWSQYFENLINIYDELIKNLANFHFKYNLKSSKNNYYISYSSGTAYNSNNSAKENKSKAENVKIVMDWNNFNENYSSLRIVPVYSHDNSDSSADENVISKENKFDISKTEIWESYKLYMKINRLIGEISKYHEFIRQIDSRFASSLDNLTSKIQIPKLEECILPIRQNHLKINQTILIFSLIILYFSKILDTESFNSYFDDSNGNDILINIKEYWEIFSQIKSDYKILNSDKCSKISSSTYTCEKIADLIGKFSKLEKIQEIISNKFLDWKNKLEAAKLE